MDTAEFEQHSALTEKTREEFKTKLRARLDSYWVIEESALGGFLIGCAENIYMKAHVHGDRVIVHRVRTVEDVLDMVAVDIAVKYIGTFLESREDELRDMKDAPKNGKPFLVLIERGSGERLFRVGYFYQNVSLVGDCFEFDRNCIGWVPIAGINYVSD